MDFNLLSVTRKVQKLRAELTIWEQWLEIIKRDRILRFRLKELNQEAEAINKELDELPKYISDVWLYNLRRENKKGEQK